MTTIHRSPFEDFTTSVDWLCERYGCDRRLATYLLWDVAFTVGTDRHYWIDDCHARRFIDNNTPIAV